MKFNTDYVESVFAMYSDKDECKVYLFNKLFEHRFEIKRDDYLYLVQYISEWA